MAKKITVADYIRSVGAGYLTHRRFVYLGRNASKRARCHALLAGLTPVTCKQYKKMISNSQAMERIQYGGIWHDTVRY